MEKSLLLCILILFFALDLVTSQIFLNEEENKDFDFLVVDEMIYEDYLNISYSFDHSRVIGDSVALEIWITNKTGEEVKKITEFLKINRDEKIQDEILIPVTFDISDLHYIYFSFSEDKGSYVKYSFYLEKEDTGFKEGESISNSYLLILLIIILLVLILILINSSFKTNFKKNK